MNIRQYFPPCKQKLYRTSPKFSYRLPRRSDILKANLHTHPCRRARARPALCERSMLYAHHHPAHHRPLCQARRALCPRRPAPYLERSGRPGRRQRLLARRRHLRDRPARPHRRQTPVHRVQRRQPCGHRLLQRPPAGPAQGRVFHLPLRPDPRHEKVRQPAPGGRLQRPQRYLPPDGGLHLLRRAVPRGQLHRDGPRPL